MAFGEKYALHSGGWGLLCSHPKHRLQNSRHFILSQFCCRWHGPGHYKSLLKRNASCPRDRTGTLLCGSCAGIPPDPWKEIHGKKIQLLAALAIVLGTRLQTWLRAVSETTLGPSASIQGAVKAIRSQSCSSLQGIEPLWSLWRSGFYEQFEGAQLWSFCASHLALQTAAWEEKGQGVCYIIIAYPVIPGSCFWQRNTS